MPHLFVLILSVVAIALAFHFSGPQPKALDAPRYLPKAEYVRMLSLGQNVSAAGLLWIRGILDLGNSYYQGTEYNYLGHVGNLATTLDSLFYTPYAFVGCMTPVASTDTSDIPMLRRGIRVYPDDWKLALYYAMRVTNCPLLKDNKDAARVMKRFANGRDPNVPKYLGTLYHLFELGAMQTELALDMILNDAVRPEYSSFRNSLYAKTFYVLGYKAADAKNPGIKKTLDAVIDHKMDPRDAFRELLSMRKKDATPAVAAP